MDDKVVPIRKRKPQTHEEQVLEWFGRYARYLEQVDGNLLSNEQIMIRGVELRAEALDIKHRNC